MIEFTRAFVSNGQTYATLEKAQQAEIKSLAASKMGNQSMSVEDWTLFLVQNKQEIIDILTTTASSKPKARAIHGGRKPRKAAPEPELPIKAA